MNGSMHLDGAEDVRRAGANISGAAETMSRAAATFSEAATNLTYAFDSFYERMQVLVDRIEEAARKAKP